MPMEKKKSFLGVLSKRVAKKPKKTKKSYKNKFLRKVVDYLKSDFYMFAPLASSPSTNISPTKKFSYSSCYGVDKALKSTVGRKTNFLNKLEEYLTSDLYMYAPLVDSQPSEVTLAVPPMKVATTTSVLPEEISEEIEQLSKSNAQVPSKEGAVVRHTIAHRETEKHVIYRDCRSSSLPGKRVIATRQRKLVELPWG